VQADHHALENLDPLLAALNDPHVHADCVTYFDLCAAFAAAIQQLVQLGHMFLSPT